MLHFLVRLERQEQEPSHLEGPGTFLDPQELRFDPVLTEIVIVAQLKNWDYNY